MAVLLMRSLSTVDDWIQSATITLKPSLFGVSLQQIHIAFAIVAEGIILADDDGLHPDSFHQDVLDEGSCRQRGKVHGEGDTDQRVDAGFFDQFLFLLI